VRGRGRPIPKGVSGNPSGRPRQDQSVVELARVNGPLAIKVLIEVMTDRRASASARALAADRLLDRGFGRPPQTNTVIAATRRRASDLSDDELASIVAGGQPGPSAPAEPEAEQPPTDPKRVN
jgi:hypothetical protein